MGKRLGPMIRLAVAGGMLSLALTGCAAKEVESSVRSAVGDVDWPIRVESDDERKVVTVWVNVADEPIEHFELEAIERRADQAASDLGFDAVVSLEGGITPTPE
jgi:hypothetical protein